MTKLPETLITGGTGTIGKELAMQLTIQGYLVTIFSRNEHNQVVMKYKYPNYKYILGDVRDENALVKACKGKDYVFHLAALKHVDICEKQPIETVKTNINGTMNVISACISQGCKLINITSDKAVRPDNIYGKTKSIAESMINETGFTNIRSGNVLWSSGSVLQVWKKQIEDDNCIKITDDRMTRFFIHPTELCEFIINHMDEQGTFTVPLKSFRIIDVAKEFIKRLGNEKTDMRIKGLRPGERLHEFLGENISSEQNICTDLNYIFQ